MWVQALRLGAPTPPRRVSGDPQASAFAPFSEGYRRNDCAGVSPADLPSVQCKLHRLAPCSWCEFIRTPSTCAPCSWCEFIRTPSTCAPCGSRAFIRAPCGCALCSSREFIRAPCDCAPCSSRAFIRALCGCTPCGWREFIRASGGARKPPWRTFCQAAAAGEGIHRLAFAVGIRFFVAAAGRGSTQAGAGIEG
jgi:hypothetical protein